MLNELKTIEPQLKQILYECVEHVQATKAALYLSTSADLNEKKFELITSYQYNPADRRVVTANDDLVDRLTVKRGPFFVNGLGSDQRLAEMLFRQGNDRILATPLFSRGRLVGFIDMRDKAGKKPFEPSDLEAAKRISDQMLGVLGANKLFGVAPIALAEEASQTAVHAQPERPSLRMASTPPPMQAAAPQPRPGPAGQAFSSEALQAIETARQIMSKRQLAPANASGRRALGESDIDALRLLLPAALAIPGAAAACFSLSGAMPNPLAMVSIATVTPEALDVLQQHLQSWLKRANQPHMTAVPAQSYPFGTQPLPVTADAITAIVSLPVAPQSFDALVLTVVFERATEAQAQRATQIFLRQMEQSIEGAVQATGGRSDRQLIAERILEPDFRKYPDLADHCREVAVIAHRLSKVLELPPAQQETVRIAALVHDVGLRLLDYDRLYRRANLTPEEMRALAEHPLVGAALVEPLLGSEVAHAVLRHHERVDGKGYPSRLTGQQIPLAARIIAVADAWVAMTSRQSYQPAIQPEQAVARLREGAGTQFDPTIVERFLRALPELL